MGNELTTPNPLTMLHPPTLEERIAAMERLLTEIHAAVTHFQEMATKIEEGIAQSPMASMLGMRR